MVLNMLALFVIMWVARAWEMDNMFVAFDDINGIDFLNSNYSTFKVVVAPSAVKYEGNPILIADKPWEAGTLDNGYFNIVVNENRTQWQVWYQAFFYKGNEALENTGVLYAESKDGITWNKPTLNIVSINGSTANNAICRACHGWGVWRDAEYNNAYKAIGALQQTPSDCNNPSDCTILGISTDGIHWNNFTRPKMGNRFDTHNIMFLDPKSNRYLVWTRSTEFPPRIIARSEGDSSDFLYSKYEQVQNVNQGITMNDQLHDQIVMPFHSVYIGFITVFQTENPNQITDCGLAWSTDSKEWFRLGYHNDDANIIRRDVNSKDFDSHLCFAGLFPVDMNENTTRFYYAGANNTFFPGNPGRQTCMGFANIRKDGWAGLTNTNKQETANLISHSFTVNGDNLIITIDVYSEYNGSIRVGFVGVNNYEIKDCLYVKNNVTNYIVKWNSGSDISSLNGKKVQLQFELNNAVLYTYGTVKSSKN